MSDPAGTGTPPAEQPQPRRREPLRRTRPRRRAVPLVLALAGAVVALLLGAVLGYLARGEPDPPPIATLERPLPVLTVTAPGRAPRVTVMVTVTVPRPEATAPAREPGATAPGAPEAPPPGGPDAPTTSPGAGG